MQRFSMSELNLATVREDPAIFLFVESLFCFFGVFLAHYGNALGVAQSAP